MKQAQRQPELRGIVERAVVVAYREDTSVLEAALRAAGFADVAVRRATYAGEEESYSKNFRCFMNHRDAWVEAAARPGWTMIVEADFVPCADIGALPVPVPESSAPGLKWAFLYTASPRIFWEEAGGFLRGHQATTVCYLITGAVASKLLSFWDDEVREFGMGSYFTFDAHLSWALIGKGCEAYFPLRSYGEHGGMPNPEHREEGSLPGDGMHRADVLQGRLAFLPPYADGNWPVYWCIRFGSRLKSLARLLTGRWMMAVTVSQPRPVRLLRLFWLGLTRHLTV